MSTFFQQTAQAMIAKHIDRFPLLKLDQVIDWQPIEQYLNRQKTVTSETTAAVPPTRCCPCSKPSCSDNGTASPIPNSNTASLPASTSTCFAVSTN
ncbi:putative transposase [Neisseria meningitidis 70030]|nr:putative transposase [Neisseria meningitidis 70030]